MLRDVLARVSEDVAAAVLYVWAASAGVTLSNGNRTGSTSSSETKTSYSTPVISGSSYIEVSVVFGDWGINNIALVAGDGTVIPALQGASNEVSLYSFSYNATTGAYKIKRNNTVINSGTNLKSNVSVRVQTTSAYNPASYTINSGQAAFAYTPEYL